MTPPKNSGDGRVGNKNGFFNSIVQRTGTSVANRQGTDIGQAQTDAFWSTGAEQQKASNTYFDYYFTGQDIRVYIDGVDDPGSEIPIMDFAWNASQKKIPVYGFWSYRYDHIMRGNRIVSGAFRIATTSTDLMVRQISYAAKARNKRAIEYPIRDLDSDERNIEKYWTKNVDLGVIYNYNAHLLSSHPPFNFVIVYGLQSTSINPSQNNFLSDVYEEYQKSDPLFTDVNERLVEADLTNSMRYMLEAVEITGVQIEYSPDGTPLSEVYTFFARDVFNPKV